MMRRLYVPRDAERGIAATFNRLVDEVKELGDALNANDKEELEKEFADVIAWLASLANLVEVNLEAAAVSKYNHRCPRCKHSPCECDL